MNGFVSDEQTKPKPGFKSYMASTNNSMWNSNREKHIPNMKLPKLEKILSSVKELEEIKKTVDRKITKTITTCTDIQNNINNITTNIEKFVTKVRYFNNTFVELYNS